MFRKKNVLILKKFVFYAFLGVLVSASNGDEPCGCGDFGPPTHNITLSPTSIDFGEIRVGSSSTESLIIANPNEYIVTIEDLKSTNPEVFRVVDLPTQPPFRLGGKSKVTIYIGFYPQQAISYEEALIITSESEEEGSQTNEVPLKGIGD